MKKINTHPYQRNIQTSQDDRNPRVQRPQRSDRLRDNLTINQYANNNQHYRKHNSPDANKLRIHQNQLFLSKNSKPRTQYQQLPQKTQHLNQRVSQNPQYLKPSNSYKSLTKTSSSPKLLSSGQSSSNFAVQPKKQVLYTETDQYRKLHQKLNSIEDKILSMKQNIQRKRQQKQKLEKQRKQKLESQRVQSAQKNKKNLLQGLVTQVPEHKQLHTFDRNPYSPRHNIYYVSEVIRAYLDQKSLAREHILTSLHILRILQKSEIPSEQEIKKRKVDMPLKKGKQGRKCVVFDLDETLIHCNDSLTPPHDVKLPIKFPTGEIIEAGINIRPYAKQILKNLAKNFEVVVFTASHSCYANVVLDYLDPNDQYIDHRLYRQHCYQTAEGMYVKDLRVLSRDLKDVVLIDNAAYSYAFQLDNGIPILPYYHGTHDYQLNALEKYINQFVLVNDVRVLNRKTFGLHKYKNYYGEPQRMVEQLYINEEIQENNKK